MSYVSSRLFEGEVIRHSGAFHWLWHLRAWAALIVLGVLVIGIVIFIAEMIRFRTTEMVVTSRRIVVKRGFLSASLNQLSLDAMETSHIRQGLLGRLFGFGNLVIMGRGEGQLHFPPMAEPGAFVAAAEKARQEAEHEPAAETTQAADRKG